MVYLYGTGAAGKVERKCSGRTIDKSPQGICTKSYSWKSDADSEQGPIHFWVGLWSVDTGFWGWKSPSNGCLFCTDVSIIVIYVIIVSIQSIRRGWLRQSISGNHAWEEDIHDTHLGDTYNSTTWMDRSEFNARVSPEKSKRILWEFSAGTTVINHLSLIM